MHQRHLLAFCLPIFFLLEHFEMALQNLKRKQRMKASKSLSAIFCHTGTCPTKHCEEQVPQKAKETFATLSNYHLRRPLR
jgi:hypothetical protein